MKIQVSKSSSRFLARVLLFLGGTFGGFSILMSLQTVRAQDLPPLEVVPYVDLNRYLGEWNAIARFDHRFERGCVRSQALYTQRSDGDIQVLNTCTRADGSQKSVSGKAWVVDPVTQAKLKVRFFWPFSGNYWVIELGEQYEYVVVSEPNREYLWILSREKTMAPEVYAGILDRLQAKGFDVSKLIPLQ